jgi:hypothetical protein
VTGTVVNSRGWYGSPINRRGKNRRRIWQALMGYDRPLTTRELVQFVYPRLGPLRNPSAPLPIFDPPQIFVPKQGERSPNELQDRR